MRKVAIVLIRSTGLIPMALLLAATAGSVQAAPGEEPPQVPLPLPAPEVPDAPAVGPSQGEDPDGNASGPPVGGDLPGGDLPVPGFGPSNSGEAGSEPDEDDGDPDEGPAHNRSLPKPSPSAPPTPEALGPLREVADGLLDRLQGPAPPPTTTVPPPPPPPEPDSSARPQAETAADVSSLPHPAARAALAATALALPLAAWWALARRITAQNALDSPARRHLYTILQRYPGLRMCQLSKLAGLSHSGTEHHVRLLELAGLVREERHSEGPRFHVSGPVHRDQAELRARDLAFSTSPARALLELVQAKPGIALSEASRLLETTPSLVHYHAGRLARLGLLTSSKEAGARRLYPRAAPL